MVDQDEAETARCRRRSRRVLLVIEAVPVLATMIIAGVYVWAKATSATQCAFENNWGVLIPEGLKIVEYHAEESFHGDGVRLTVFEVEDPASVEGTFFDLGHMSNEALTQEESEFVDLVNKTFGPENRLSPPILSYSRRIGRDTSTGSCLSTNPRAIASMCLRTCSDPSPDDRRVAAEGTCRVSARERGVEPSAVAVGWWSDADGRRGTFGQWPVPTAETVRAHRIAHPAPPRLS